MRYYKKQTRCWAQIPSRRAASIVPRRCAADSMRAVMHHRLLRSCLPCLSYGGRLRFRARLLVEPGVATDADLQLRVGLGRRRRHRPEPVRRRPRHAACIGDAAAVRQPEAVARRRDGRAAVRSREHRVAVDGAADRADATDRHRLPERLPAQHLRRVAPHRDGRPADGAGDGGGDARLRHRAHRRRRDRASR